MQSFFDFFSEFATNLSFLFIIHIFKIQYKGRKGDRFDICGFLEKNSEK